MVSDSGDPKDCSLPGSSVHGIFSQKFWIGLPIPSPEDLLPGIEEASPVLAGSFLTTVPQGSPCKTTLDCIIVCISCSGVPDSLQCHGLKPARLLCPWHSPGKNTRVGCHFLLQGLFPTQGSNLGLLQSRQILYHMSHQGRRLPYRLSFSEIKMSKRRLGNHLPIRQNFLNSNY